MATELPDHGRQDESSCGEPDRQRPARLESASQLGIAQNANGQLQQPPPPPPLPLLTPQQQQQRSLFPPALCRWCVRE